MINRYNPSKSDVNLNTFNREIDSVVHDLINKHDFKCQCPNCKSVVESIWEIGMRYPIVHRCTNKDCKSYGVMLEAHEVVFTNPKHM